MRGPLADELQPPGSDLRVPANAHRNAEMKKFFTFILFLSFASTLRADELRLSLQKAIEMALGSGTQAQLAHSEEERARIARREALGDMLPQADARFLRYNQSINLQTFGFEVPGQPPIAGPFNVTDAQVSAAMQLFNVAAIRRYQSLQLGERATHLDSLAADNDVAAAVARLYVLIQRADAQVESRRADVTLFERLVTAAEHEFEAGVGTKLDIAQQNLQLRRVRQALLLAENDRRNASLALANAIGADESAEIVPTDPLPTANAPPAADAALVIAREQRPDLRALRLHEDEARLNLQAQQARRLPALSADFEGDLSGNQADDLRWTRRIAGVVSVPLFRSDINAAIARAQLQFHDARVRREQYERDVEQEVRRALLGAESASARVVLAGEAVQVAEQALTIARDRRSAGYGSPIEVDRAEDSYRQAREDLISAQADAAAAQYEVRRSTGEISTLRSEVP
jgi:outer membrane protein TolC